MGKAAGVIGIAFVTALVYLAIASVVAFPFMWGWNYAFTHVFKAPPLNWGQSFVFMLMMGACLSGLNGNK